MADRCAISSHCPVGKWGSLTIKDSIQGVPCEANASEPSWWSRTLCQPPPHVSHVRFARGHCRISPRLHLFSKLGQSNSAILAGWIIELFNAFDLRLLVSNQAADGYSLVWEDTIWDRCPWANKTLFCSC